MSAGTVKTMRDAFISKLCDKMQSDDRLFFVTADFGAPSLDNLRENFPDRFINIGIAEQNLINVSVGLALEGFIVYAYAISAFLTMRGFEQIRNNISLLSHHREMNINLIGVGAGCSYDMSGPSHHCLEDISIIRTLPNIDICSPCDWVTAQDCVDFTIENSGAKYLRFDGKPCEEVYDDPTKIQWDKGFSELKKGSGVCIISTGYQTHRALQIADELNNDGISMGLIDMFKLGQFDKEALFDTLKKYHTVITIEEAFVNRAGLDSMIYCLLRDKDSSIKTKSFGFNEQYVFGSANRESISEIANFGKNEIIKTVKSLQQNID